MSYLSKRSKTAFGSSASCTTILDISTSNRGPCSPSTTRSARGCHPCLRYVPLPMSPGRTTRPLVTPGGLEPPTNSLEGCCSVQLSYGADGKSRYRPAVIGIKTRTYVDGAPARPG